MPRAAEILRENPALHEVLPLCERAAANSVSEASLGLLRARNFDVALCTDNVRHHEALQIALALGIPNRIAFVRKGLSGLATFGVRVARDSWPAHIRAMVNAVAGTRDESPLRPRIYLDTDDSESADAAWGALPFPDAPLTIATAITTRQPIGLFPLPLFAAVLRCVLQIEPGTRFLLAGSRDDSATLDALADDLGPRATVHAGTLSLRTFTGVVSRCDAFFGSDSGPRHIANAAGIPVLFVRNMSVPEIEAGRYCDTETDVTPPGQYLSSDATAHALSRIDVEAVAGAVVAAARRTASTRRT
ncbi:MAG: glycosyltransferase family 9 protein [Gemmatimonadaceae bacterium]